MIKAFGKRDRGEKVKPVKFLEGWKSPKEFEEMCMQTTSRRKVERERRQCALALSALTGRAEQQHQHQHHQPLELPNGEQELPDAEVAVRFIHLLLENTAEQCDREEAGLHERDPFEQILLLRGQANMLRAMCGLPAKEVVYTVDDARIVVQTLSRRAEYATRPALHHPVGALSARLQEEYSGITDSLPVI